MRQSQKDKFDHLKFQRWPKLAFSFIWIVSFEETEDQLSLWSSVAAWGAESRKVRSHLRQHRTVDMPQATFSYKSVCLLAPCIFCPFSPPFLPLTTSSYPTSSSSQTRVSVPHYKSLNFGIKKDLGKNPVCHPHLIHEETRRRGTRRPAMPHSIGHRSTDWNSTPAI